MNPAPPASGRSAFHVLAAVLIAGFIALGIFELQAARAEWAKLAELGRQRAADQRRLEVLAQAPAPAAAPSAPAAPSPAPAKAPGDDRRAKQLEARAKGQAYAKAFLAKYPQARAMLIEFQTRNMENYYAPFFRAAGLTPAQINEFVARTAEAHLDSLILNPNGNWSNGQPNMPAADARALLGDAGYQQWQDSARLIPAEGWVQGLAAAVKNGADPLSADQALQLTQLVASNSPDYAAGKRVNPQTVDMTSVVAQAKPLLSDAQWQQAQDFLTIQEANRQLRALIGGNQ
jgi:hypothetical protein